MLKYVALLKVDKPKLWSEWHSLPTEQYFKSPIETDKEKVVAWQKKELEKYPNARVNERMADRDYLIYTSIIAFDNEKSTNVEEFLNAWLPF